MKLLNTDRSILMEVTRFEREGDDLVIVGSIMGALPVRAILTPTESRRAPRLIPLRLKFFLLTLLFRS